MSQSDLDTIWAWMVTALVVAALLAELRSDIRRLVRARSVVLLGILSWYLYEGIKLSPGLKEFDQTTYNFSILCVLLSAIGFLVGYHTLPPCQWADRVATRFRALDDPELLWRVVLVCAILGFAPIAYYSGLEVLQ